MHCLLCIAVESLEMGLAVDVLIGLPNHVDVKLDYARGGESPEHGKEDLLKKRILDHALCQAGCWPALPEPPLACLENVDCEGEIGDGVGEHACSEIACAPCDDVKKRASNQRGWPVSELVFETKCEAGDAE